MFFVLDYWALFIRIFTSNIISSWWSLELDTSRPNPGHSLLLSADCQTPTDMVQFGLAAVVMIHIRIIVNCLKFSTKMLVVCSVLKEDLTQLLHVNAEAKDKTQISSSFVKIVLDIQASKYIRIFTTDVDVNQWSWLWNVQINSFDILIGFAMFCQPSQEVDVHLFGLIY